MIPLSGFMLRDLRGARKLRSLWVFSACLLLGITLISACGSLLHLVRDGFEQQQRNLFGGDLQISQRQNITNAQHNWLKDNARVSRVLELRTMIGTPAGEFTVVELQSVDDTYPLYGQLKLEPVMTLKEAVSQSDSGVWGAAFDPALVEQLSLEVGQLVSVGNLQLELRAVIVEQPDRSLRANFRGPPVIIDEEALELSGLFLPTSLIDYEYRIRTDENPAVWRDHLRAAFPDASWEVQTVEERGDLVEKRLNQVASVLLLIGFSTLLIGGLGVANSVGAYLQTKLRTVATLQALGARAPQVASVYIGQVALLATFSSTAGAVAGTGVAWLAARALSGRLPTDTSLEVLMPTMLAAIMLGVCTALTFTLPTLGRTLNAPTAMLIRGIVRERSRAPAAFGWAAGFIGVLCVMLLLLFIPEPLVAAAFIVSIVLLLLILDGIVRIIRTGSRRLTQSHLLDGYFALRMAVAGLSRPHATLRPMLLSLGTALTLLVASALIIASTYQTLKNTVPDRAPSLVFYDLQKPQVQDFTALVASLEGYQSHVVAPLVLGRLTSVNGTSLIDSSIAARALEANDEHKLSYRKNSIDNIALDRGEWWSEDYAGPPLVAMEDREADQLGLEVGDRLQFTIMNETVDVTLTAIYSQARFETSFWLEAVFSDNVLEPYITRYVGSLTLLPGKDIAAQSTLGDNFPNIVTIRTAKVLEASRAILATSGLAMMLIAAVSIGASVLVMASVVAVNRQRQVYEASVLLAIGTRMSVIMKSVVFEYGLLAIILSLFAMITGGALAQVLLNLWLKIDSSGSAWAGIAVATSMSMLCLFAGALWLVLTLRATPAKLLTRGV